MSGGGGSARVPNPIPSHSQKVIQDIREITSKQHSDDEIYAVLRECSMDPNETAQKLLYLDTFHEVRRRRDRKKEGLSSWASVDSKPKQVGQGRGGRGASGGYSSNFSGSGGRNANRKEVGVNHVAERSLASSAKPAAQKTKSNGASHITRVSAAAPSPANQLNGIASHGLAGQLLMGSVNGSPALGGTSKHENTQPHPVVSSVSPRSQTFKSVTRTDHGKSTSSFNQLPISASSVPSVHSSSNPVLAPSILLNTAIGSANFGEVGSHQLADGLNHVYGNKVLEVGELPASESERSGSLHSTNNKKTQNKSNEVEENQLTEAAQSSSPSYNDLRRPSSCGSQAPPEDSTSEVCVQSSDELRQHVIVTFPNHFQVPEALKSGLIFGSFDTDFDKEMSSMTDGGNNTSSALHSSQGSDKTTTSSDQSASPTAPGDHSDDTHSPSYLNEKPSVSEVNTVSGTEPKVDQPKQEVLLAPVGTPIPTMMNGQSYGLNFMPTMLGTQQVQFKGAEPQAQETTGLPNYSANSHSVSNPSPSPSPSPSPTPPLQTSLPTAPQSISFCRPPYPPNFFPYAPYYPPIYVSPIHQYLNHNGFPQQPSSGNIYVPAAAAGIKFPLQQLKAGANTGNTPHIGISPGSFISPPVGYAPNQTVNSGNLTGSEDLAMSQLKENNVFTTGQLSEGSAVWIPAPGQEISNLQLNSLYNFNHQGHLMYPPTQAGHAFAGIYQPGQTVPSSSTLLQQSQSVPGSAETAGAPSVAFQQPQHVQTNWSSNF